MKMLHSIAAIALVASLAASSGAFAETPAAAPATTPAPAAKATAAAPMDKAAISKACSQQADEKGLKGKARKHFRSKCKRHGGTAE